MSESSRSRILRFACVMMAVLVVLAHPAIVDSVSAAGNGELTIDVEHENGNQADEVNALIIYQDGSYYDEIKNYPGVDLKHTFSNLPTGHDYKVNAYIHDQFAGSTGAITIPADNGFTWWDESSKSDQITAENPIELSPTIYYSDGSTPIEGASVRVKSHEDDPNGPGKVVWRTATTESDGETDPSPLSLYPTDGDDPGKYTVEVLQDGEKISSGDYDELNTDVDLKVITDASVPEYDLSASADPSYAGDVDGEPFGSVEQGTEIQLTADPDSGHEFDHWSGDYPSGSREDADISVTVTEDKSLTAHFEEIPEYDLSVSSSSGGTVETSNTGSIQEGTDVSLTADATQGYKFSHWSGDYPSGSREDADISVTMYRDRELTANFEKLEGDLTVDVRHQNGDRAEEVNALVVWQDEVGGEPYKKFENNPSVAIKQKINNLPGDHRYKVNAYINDQFAGATDWVNIKNSDKSSTIRVENPVWIKPTVYYTDGSTPLEDATVKIESHEGTQWRSSTTEEDGLTSAGKLWLFPTNKGHYDVQVYSEGSRVASKTFNSLDSNRELRLVTSVSPPTQIDTTVVGRTVREETEQDGTITVGERTKVDTTVRNDGTKMPLRVVFQFDTDGDSEPEAIDISGDSDPERVDYDEDGDNEPGTVRGNVEKTTVPEGEAQGFGLEYTPDLAGEWQVRAVIQAKPDTEWVQTDETAWKQYEVAGETEEAAFIQRDRDVIAPLPTGSFEWGKGLTAETTVKNTGTVKETFYVGYTASHKQSDRSYDVPERSVTLAPGETTDVALTWTVPNGAPTGKYQLDLALWRKSTDDGLTGNLDRVTGTVTVTPTEGAPIIVGYDPQDETFDNRTLARTEEKFEWADASVPAGQSSQDLDIPNIPDSPTRINSTEKYPWSAVGRLRGSGSSCSGVVIEDNHILTAAHCIYDPNRGEINADYFTPGRDGNSYPFPFLTANRIEYIQTYKQAIDNAKKGIIDTGSSTPEVVEPYDIAILTTKFELGSQTGEFGFVTKKSDSGLYAEQARITGYPVSKPNDFVPTQYTQIDIPVSGNGADGRLDPSLCPGVGSCHVMGTGRLVEPNISGASGGPVWQSSDDGPRVLSVASAKGAVDIRATRISSNKYSDIGTMIEYGNRIKLDPTPRFSVDNSRVSVGQQLTFDASESRDPDQGNIQSYEWYFDRDPSTSSPDMTTQSPVVYHTFNEPGEHTISLRVVDNEGQDRSRDTTVRVTDGPTGEDLATLVDDKTALPSGKFGPGDDVTATVTVENTGTVEETFHVGYTLTHRDSGTAYDVSPKDVTLAPGATQEVTLSWTVPETTQLGEFEATTAVWLDSTDEGLVGRQDDATETVTVTPDTPEFQNRAVYVWGYAGTLATNDDTANRFFERATDEDINTVFLSWGAFKSVSVSERAAFIKKAHKNNLQVHALIGTSGRTAVTNAKKTIPEIIAYNEGRDSAAQFDGIHLDAEPGGADVKSFLDEYRTLLDGVRTDIQSDSGASINSQKMALSAAVGPWWSNNAPTKTKQVVEQSALDYVVVMAYSDTEQEIKNRLSKITSDTDTPYVLAVETQEFTQGDKEDVTYYEEGQQDVKSTLQSIAGASSPGYLGSAYHFYQSSVSTWDALESASLRKTTIEPGDRVTVDTDVVFDDNFPQSSHRSQVRVEFDRQGSTYTVQETKTITPPGNQLTETSVEWQAPTDAQPGEYQVTASLVDTTRENDDREAVASRSEPITLDQIKLGTLEINEGAPSDPTSDQPLYTAGFESTPSGETPLDWTASGNSAIRVSNAQAADGTKSLRLSGSSGGCLETVGFGNLGQNGLFTQSTAGSVSFSDRFDDGTLNSQWEGAGIDDPQVTESDGTLSHAVGFKYNSDNNRLQTTQTFDATGTHRIEMRVRTTQSDYWGYGVQLDGTNGSVSLKEHKWERFNRFAVYGVTDRPDKYSSDYKYYGEQTHKAKLADATSETSFITYSLTVNFDTQTVTEVRRGSETWETDLQIKDIGDSYQLRIADAGHDIEYDAIAVGPADGDWSLFNDAANEQMPTPTSTSSSQSMNISFSVRPGGQAQTGCHDHNTAVNLNTGNDGTYGGKNIKLIEFTPDGSVEATFGENTPLGSYDVGTWTDVRVKYTPLKEGQARVAYFIDGEQRETITRGEPSFADQLSYLQVNTGEYTTYVDDINLTTASSGVGDGDVDNPLPTTSLRFTDQTLPNGSSTVTVDTAQFGNESVPGEKFVVVVHKTTESIYDDEIGPKVGESDVLSPGTRQSVEVDLSQTLAPSDDMAELTKSQSLVAMLHRADTDDGDNINHGSHITRDGDTVTSRAQLTVSSSSTPALRTHRNLTSTEVTNGSTVTVTVTGNFESPTDDAKLVDTISGGGISAENLTITDAAGAAFPVITPTPSSAPAPTPTVDITWNGTLGTVSEAESFTVNYEVQIPADTPVGTTISFDGDVTNSATSETTRIDGDSSVEVVATTSPDTVTVGSQEVPTEFTSRTDNGDRTVTADDAVSAINAFIAGEISANVAVDVINAFIAS